MKVLSDILHKAGILKEGAEDYSSGGYSVLVRNATTQRLETVPSSSLVPDQSGNSGKYLTTNGSTLSWGSISTDNIYNSNGVLTGNRIVNTASGYTLTINPLTTFSGSATASAGTAIGHRVTPTLTASANSDGLIGLDINPTFSVGSFTPIYRWGTRTKSLWINHSSWNAVNSTPALYIGDTSAAAFHVHPGIASSGGTTELFMRGNNPLLGAWYFTLKADYDVTFDTGGYVDNMYFKMGGSTAMTIKGSRNIIIGGSTDAGYKLDVQGTTRVSAEAIILGQIRNNAGNFGNQSSIFIRTTSETGHAATFNKGSYSHINTLQFLGNDGTQAFSLGQGRVGNENSLDFIFTRYVNPTWTEVYRIPNSTGNFLLNTATDAGFKLDVFGTVRLYPRGAINGGFEFTFNDVYNIMHSGSHTYLSANQTMMVGAGNNSFTFIGVNKDDYITPVLVGYNSWQSNISSASAILDVRSTTRGFLQPRMTTTQRDAITTPATGLSVYNTTTNTSDFYNGSSWISGGTNIYNSDGTLTGNRTVTSGGNNLSFLGVGKLILNGSTSNFASGNLEITNNTSYYSPIVILNNGSSFRGVVVGTSNHFIFGYGGSSAPAPLANKSLLMSVGGSDILITQGLASQPSASDVTMQMFGATKNITIGGTTDSGFKLDVQGTVRISNAGAYGTRFENDKIFHQTTYDMGASSVNFGSHFSVGGQARFLSFSEINSYVKIGGNNDSSAAVSLPNDAYGLYIGNKDIRATAADNSVQHYFNIWYNDRTSSGVSKAFNIRIYGGQSSVDYGDLILQHDGTNSRGNVGIGTVPNTAYKLDVAGTGRFTSDILVNGLTVGRGGGNVSGNTVVGETSGTSFTTGSSNVAIGYRALTSITTQTSNIAVGTDALRFAVGSYNINMSYESGYSLTGSHNIGIGSQTLKVTTADGNVGIGQTALRANTTGAYSVAVGAEALLSNTTGGANTAIGTQALVNNNGGSNVAVGYQTMYSSGASQRSVVIGALSGWNITSSDNNVFVGYNTGRGITTGRANTILGSVQGLTSTLSNNIILADGDGNIRIRAFDTGNVTINSGTDAGYKLDVAGTGRFTNTLSVITTGTTNEVALFKSTEPYITIEAAGGSNSASIFLKPSTSSQNATIQNRTGGGLEFYVNADYVNPKMTIKGTTVNIRSLPTSATGLSSGDLWNDAGTLKVA